MHTYVIRRHSTVMHRILYFCTRGIQENAAIGFVVLKTTEILGSIIFFAIHFLCVSIEKLHLSLTGQG